MKPQRRGVSKPKRIVEGLVFLLLLVLLIALLSSRMLEEREAAAAAETGISESSPAETSNTGETTD